MTFRALVLLALTTTPVSAAADMTDFEKVKSAAQDEIVIIVVDGVGIVVTRLEGALLLKTIILNSLGQPQVTGFTDHSVDGIIDEVYYQGMTMDADDVDQAMFEVLIAVIAKNM